MNAIEFGLQVSLEDRKNRSEEMLLENKLLLELEFHNKLDEFRQAFREHTDLLEGYKAGLRHLPDPTPYLSGHVSMCFLQSLNYTLLEQSNAIPPPEADPPCSILGPV